MVNPCSGILSHCGGYFLPCRFSNLLCLCGQTFVAKPQTTLCWLMLESPRRCMEHHPSIRTVSVCLLLLQDSNAPPRGFCFTSADLQSRIKDVIRRVLIVVMKNSHLLIAILLSVQVDWVSYV